MTSLDRYYALKPGSYGAIVSLEFSQYETDIGTIQHDLRLTLAKSPELIGCKLMLHFHGVTQLRFEQPDWSLASFGLLEIEKRETGFHLTEEEGLIAFSFLRLEARTEDSDPVHIT